MLPIDLIFIRHGQSEENLAIKMSKKRDNSFFTPEFRSRHSRSFRLTDKGIAQAKAAGEWLRKNAPMSLDFFYVSDFVRAKETAFYLGLSQVQWEVKYELRERDQPPSFGLDYQNVTDPFLFYPAGNGGESIATLCLRLKTGFLSELEKKHSRGKGIVVSHGHVMRALQLELEGLGHDDFIRLDKSKEPADSILNCQIIWYTRCDPVTLAVNPEFVAVRSVCVRGLVGDYGWRRIQRRKYSNADLMAEVQKYPRQINN